MAGRAGPQLELHRLRRDQLHLCPRRARSCWPSSCELQEKPYYVRAHHLFCTGNCHGSYKWGSTNAYLEDDDGNPIYDWTFVDLVFDTLLKHRCKPFVELGFMPQDLADTERYDSAKDDLDSAQLPHVRLGLPAQGLSKVVRPGLQPGAPLHRALWRGRDRQLVLGAVERAGSGLLLERHGRGVQQALRLHGRGGQGGLPAGARRRPGHHQPTRRQQIGPVSGCVSRSLRQRRERLHRPARHAARFHQLSCQRRRLPRRPQASQAAAAGGQADSGRYPVSGARSSASIRPSRIWNVFCRRSTRTAGRPAAPGTTPT